ncbi:MAG: diaminopimelate epimerase [Sinobacteraceae bacterium]|nr:diaminopimelate epimerase [Nevskiaceae bacterium]
MSLAFTKMHGLGNDFVVIDATQQGFQPQIAQLSALANRRRGVGCDQILVIDPPPEGDTSIDFGYRIYNADGSQVGQCGNGVRCLARYVHDHKLSDKATLRVRTCNAAMTTEFLGEDRVRVDMGVPNFEPAAIPLDTPARAFRYSLQLEDGTQVHFGAVSMGNPHAVVEVADVDTAPVQALGPPVQQNAVFPEQANIGFVQFVGQARIRLRVFERGAGETQACGSGACAAMAVGRIWNRLDSHCTVAVHGGELDIAWEGEGHTLWMTGPATPVFEGHIEWQN